MNRLFAGAALVAVTAYAQTPTTTSNSLDEALGSLGDLTKGLEEM